jgi:hypothetical protein
MSSGKAEVTIWEDHTCLTMSTSSMQALRGTDVATAAASSQQPYSRSQQQQLLVRGM